MRFSSSGFESGIIPDSKPLLLNRIHGIEAPPAVRHERAAASLDDAAPRRRTHPHDPGRVRVARGDVGAILARLVERRKPARGNEHTESVRPAGDLADDGLA